MRHLVAEAGLADRIEVDSAGTGSWHLGYPPDPRSQAVGRARGMPLSSKARLVKPEDFVRFDYLLALDRNNFADLQRMAPTADGKNRIHLLREFEPGAGKGADVSSTFALLPVADCCRTFNGIWVRDSFRRAGKGV